MSASNPPAATLAIDDVVVQARTLGRERFVRRYSIGFLVRRPSPVSKPPAPAPDDHDEFDDEPGGTLRLGFKTGLVEQEDLAVDLIGEDVVDAAAWFVASIAKRPGNPYPERIGLGRARNCDVSIRWPRISKLHAHLHLENGVVVKITDCNSANGTFVNGRDVDSNGAPCGHGSRVRLGDFEMVLMRADEAFALFASM